uniref:CMP/dCMP-type deaminase domain-containing protein n=1 Tax=Chloropicon laureae TaxID=464258 RepID=A0A7S2Z6T2_9CHLO
MLASAGGRGLCARCHISNERKSGRVGLRRTAPSSPARARRLLGPIRANLPSSGNPSSPSSKSKSQQPQSKTMGVIKPKQLQGSVVAEDAELSTTFSRRDLVELRRACLLAHSTKGEVAPFPFAGCVLVSRKGKVKAETFQHASGTTPAEIQALAIAAPKACKGGTLYLNMEPAHALGQEASVEGIAAAGVARVVLGMANPQPHLQGKATAALREAGVQVDCLSALVLNPELEEEGAASAVAVADRALALSREMAGAVVDTLEADALWTLKGCLETNEDLLHCVAKARPLCVLKYAMTIDGKTASVSGHSAWISGTDSRKRVYEQRAECDCVVVGGETVRSDNPKLTTRQQEGHVPTRVVISRTMNLPLDPTCNLWDTGVAPSLVITEKGVRPEAQRALQELGVEVVAFEKLSLAKVVDHLYDRGYMRVLWECGGMLAGPAIAAGVVNKVMCFVAPKVIGGDGAPSPVGDGLGLEKMSEALDVTDVSYEQISQDVLATGYLPTSTSIFHVASEAYGKSANPVAGNGAAGDAEEVTFYKAWRKYGMLSNFYCVDLDIGGRTWRSVEHYYQAMKFSGVGFAETTYVMDEIAAQVSAEEAARLGRSVQQTKPHLVRGDWGQAKLEVMREALEVKFARGSPAWRLLRSTCSSESEAGLCKLIEYSPRDAFWGNGFDGRGLNWLGTMLMEIRDQDASNDEA